MALLIYYQEVCHPKGLLFSRFEVRFTDGVFYCIILAVEPYRDPGSLLRRSECITLSADDQ